MIDTSLPLSIEISSAAIAVQDHEAIEIVATIPASRISPSLGLRTSGRTWTFFDPPGKHALNIRPLQVSGFIGNAL